MGLQHLPTLHPTRVLDGICKCRTLLPAHPQPSHPLSPFTTFQTTLRHLTALVPEAACQPLPPPPPDLPLPDQPIQVGDLMSFTSSLQAPRLTPGTGYTDGSFFPASKLSGVAALLSPRQELMARTPGRPSPYRGALTGLPSVHPGKYPLH